MSETFEAERPALTRAAYRMLGSIAEAEDAVQDAFLRWVGADRDAVREPAAFLRRIVVRLCLDRLKSARARRETYLGPWLPEPLLEPEPVEDVALPLMLALERLSPLERAAFLLHDVFGDTFDEIAEALDRDPAACRQLAARARDNVRRERKRFPLPRAKALEIAAAFFRASRAGDMARLRTLLADDVRFHADGGGRRPAAPRVLEGRDEILRFLAAIGAKIQGGSSVLVRYCFVNGLPGFVSRESDGLIQTTALLVEDDRIVAVYVMRNPEKLTRLDGDLR